MLKSTAIIVRCDWKILDQRFQRVEPFGLVARARVIVEHDDLGIRPVKMMPTDFRANVIRNGDAPLLTSNVVDTHDISGVAAPEAVTNDQVFFVQVLGEVKAATKKMLARHRSAEAGAVDVVARLIAAITRFASGSSTL